MSDVNLAVVDQTWLPHLSVFADGSLRQACSLSLMQKNIDLGLRSELLEMIGHFFGL